MKVLKTIKEGEYYAVLVAANGLKVWLDISIVDNDVVVEWNQYIFHTNDPDDLKVRDFQDDPDNYDMASSMAINALEVEGYIKQDNNGNWVNVSNDFLS
jgi:hypothetical protein